MSDGDWHMTTEPAGDVTPFGHPWDANEQIAVLEKRVAMLESALRDIEHWSNEDDWHNKAARAALRGMDSKPYWGESD